MRAVPVKTAVQTIPTHEETPYHVVRNADIKPTERESAAGFEYRALLDLAWKHGSFQAFLVMLLPEAERESVTTDGHEFIYMLTGSMILMLGDEEVCLNTGDSMFFDGRIPHVPKNTSAIETRFLVIYLIDGTQGGCKKTT